MNATPTCLRGSLDVSKAHEKGYKCGAAGLSRDTNPHSPFGSERRLCAAWDEGWCDGWDNLNGRRQAMDDVSQRNALADRLEDFSVEVQEISAEVIGDMMRRGEPDAEAAYLATAEARNLVASLVAYAKRVRSGDFSEGSVWRGSRIAEMDLLPLKEVETDAGTRS